MSARIRHSRFNPCKGRTMHSLCDCSSPRPIQLGNYSDCYRYLPTNFHSHRAVPGNCVESRQCGKCNEDCFHQGWLAAVNLFVVDV